MKRSFSSLAALALFGFSACAAISPAHADLIKQNATYTRTVLMTASSDHISPYTGAASTLSVQYAQAGGAMTTPGTQPAITAQGNGRYAITLTGTYTGTLGALDLTVTASGADPSDTHDQIIPADFSDVAVAAAQATTGAANTGTLIIGQVAITGQTNKIGMNGGDSPNAVTAQAQTTANGTAIAGVAPAVWTQSSRTVTGGTVASVTGSVGSISGITFPSNFGTFSVDSSGRVTLVPGQSTVASNLPTDYQQRGVAVTLPTTAPTGYGSTSTAPTVSQIAAAILKTPANLLATDSSGNVGANNFPATVAVNNFPASVSLSPADEARLLTASTAQQAGQPVTLPSTVLSQADLAAVQQAVMTYALHAGVSFQRAMAQVYLASAAPVTPTKAGTISTNPFLWPDGTVGATSTVNSATGTRTETPGTLPN